MTQKWTLDEMEVANRLRPTKTNREISVILDKTSKAVERYFSRIGLTKEKAIADFVDIDNETKKTHNKTNLKTTWGDPYLVKSLNLNFTSKTKNNTIPVVILPDIHAGMEDMKAIELACEIIEIIRPHAIIYLGDNVDWPQISRFGTTPEDIIRAQAEVDLFHDIDSLIQNSAPHARRYWILGNHEDRLYKYLCKHPEIAMIRGAQIEAVLGLNADFRVLPNLQIIEEEIIWRDKFLIKHGQFVRKYSGMTAKAELDHEQMSGITGHTHRACQIYKTNRDKTHTWLEGGCLCSLDTPYVKNPDWQQAINIAYFSASPTNDTFHVDQILFDNYQAIVNGKLVKV